MRKFITLLSVFAIAITSCKKDETIEAKDYTTYTVTANLNSEDGVLPNDYTPPSDGRPGKNPYFFSAQFSFKLSDKELPQAVINNGDDYQYIVIPKNPEGNLNEVLPQGGDWQLMLTEYTTEEIYGRDGSWYVMPLVGVLSNSTISTVNINSDKFDTITLEDAQGLEFSKDIDNIGTQWQSYSMTEHKYVITENDCYLVKVNNDEIYKLRFMDFYGKGKDPIEKGHVTFQYELLK